MNNKISAQVAIAIVCVVLGFSISIQVKSIAKNQGNGSISSRNNEIQAMYIKEKDKNDALVKEYTKVQDDLAKYIAAINDNTQTTKLLKEQLDHAEILSGKKEVTGPGVTVKLSDSTQTVTNGMPEEYFWLHDRDILMIVNELRDAGAEAISINDERLTSISEIRCVGSVLSVNNVRIGEPFIIKAIGESQTLESALMFRGGIVSELTDYGIGCEVKKSEKLTIPAYKGAVSFKYAAPVIKTGGAE